MKKEIRERLINTLQNVDIFIDDDFNDDDIDIRNYITSSIQFISFIFEIERDFNIEIPDEMLVIDNFSSLNELTEKISNLIKRKNYEI